MNPVETINATEDLLAARGWTIETGWWDAGFYYQPVYNRDGYSVGRVRTAGSCEFKSILDQIEAMDDRR